MAKGKKYDYRVVQDDTSWTAEIVRQVTSRRTVVSKSQKGFSSEAEAQAWGEKELKGFLQNLAERNQRRNEQREAKAAAAAEASARKAGSELDSDLDDESELESE